MTLLNLIKLMISAILTVYTVKITEIEGTDYKMILMLGFLSENNTSTLCNPSSVEIKKKLPRLEMGPGCPTSYSLLIRNQSEIILVGDWA